jgi:hypothetical protein
MFPGWAGSRAGGAWTVTPGGSSDRDGTAVLADVLVVMADNHQGGAEGP